MFRSHSSGEEQVSTNTGPERGRHRGSWAKRSVVLITLALLTVAGSAAVSFDKERTDERYDHVLGGTVSTPMGELIACGDLSTPGASGEFTAQPGYIYRIEVASGSGGNSVSGSPGGQGCTIVCWLDMRGATAPEVYSYSLISGGASGLPNPYTGHFGGAGGYAAMLKDGSGTIMIVAGGGGGGGANGGSGGSAGAPGASGTKGTNGSNSAGGMGGTQTAGGLGGYVLNGAGGTGGGIGDGRGGDGGAVVGCYGGGGGGAGYTGGGGGSGASIGAAGGGGGGSSYVNNKLTFESFKLGRGPIPMKVAEYVSSDDVKICAFDKTVTYNCGPQCIDAPTAFPAWMEEEITIIYVGVNGSEYGPDTAPPVNAGTYDVIISINDASYSGQIKVTLTICPILLPKPSAHDTSFEYTGLEQMIGLDDFDDATMDVIGNKRTDAGDYSTVISLHDPVNYHWSDGSGGDGGTDDVKIQWRIMRTATSSTATLGASTYSAAGPSNIWAVLTPLLILSTILSISWGLRTAVVGIVRKNGIAVANALISYTVNGEAGSVMTDSAGRYVIFAHRGDDIVITSVTKGGLDVPGELPLYIKVEERITEIDIAAAAQ